MANTALDIRQLDSLVPVGRENDPNGVMRTTLVINGVKHTLYAIAVFYDDHGNTYTDDELGQSFLGRYYPRLVSTWLTVKLDGRDYIVIMQPTSNL